MPAPAPAIAASASAEPVADEDDFINDMKSILSGEMVFDPSSKKAVQKSALSQSTKESAAPAPDGKNGQAIFDRIAESMQYANAYNLGTIELENRFADFDAMSDIRRRRQSGRRRRLRRRRETARRSQPR